MWGALCYLLTKVICPLHSLKYVLYFRILFSVPTISEIMKWKISAWKSFFFYTFLSHRHNLNVLILIYVIVSADALNTARLEASFRPQGETSNEKKWPDLTTMACGLLLALSFLQYIYPPLGWLALGSVVIGFPRVLFRAIASIKALTLNINILVLLAGKSFHTWVILWFELYIYWLDNEKWARCVV